MLFTGDTVRGRGGDQIVMLSAFLLSVSSFLILDGLQVIAVVKNVKKEKHGEEVVGKQSNLLRRLGEASMVT